MIDGIQSICLFIFFYFDNVVVLDSDVCTCIPPLYSLFYFLHQKQDQEAAELSKTMMSKKTKRLYGRMQHGLEQKKQQVQSLVQKRERTETKAVTKENKDAKDVSVKRKK